MKDATLVFGFVAALVFIIGVIILLVSRHTPPAKHRCRHRTRGRAHGAAGGYRGHGCSHGSSHSDWTTPMFLHSALDDHRRHSHSDPVIESAAHDPGDSGGSDSGGDSGGGDSGSSD